jgi:hypothetical protein
VARKTRLGGGWFALADVIVGTEIKGEFMGNDWGLAVNVFEW